jgi:hypothetical protein
MQVEIRQYLTLTGCHKGIESRCQFGYGSWGTEFMVAQESEGPSHLMFDMHAASIGRRNASKLFFPLNRSRDHGCYSLRFSIHANRYRLLNRCERISDTLQFPLNRLTTNRFNRAQ